MCTYIAYQPITLEFMKHVYILLVVEPNDTA